MRLLLDTHTFLWLLESPEKLSETALEACKNLENELWLSTRWPSCGSHSRPTSADREGLDPIVETLERFAQEIDERYAPSEALRGFAASGGFYG